MKSTVKCALCEQLIQIEPGTPSYMREHYIDGAGQLCEDCYGIIAANKEWHDLA